MTFDEAVERAIERNPTVGQAAQAILRAQALLDQAKAVFRPSLYGNVGTTVILDAARGFDGNVTQPRAQIGLQRDAVLPGARRLALGREEPGRRPGGDRPDLRARRPAARWP